MKKSESVRERRFRVADAAAKSFNSVSQIGSEQIGVDSRKREISHTFRETLRPANSAVVLATERILRNRDQSSLIAPTDSAKKAGIAVARIFDLQDTNEPKGFGTGFLIAPNIMITNWHVFETAGDASGCAANFLYEQSNQDGSIQNGVSYRLRPDVFFYSFKALDVALLYVEENPIEGQRVLTTLGIIPMIGSKGKVKNGSNLNIIQYSGGGLKKYTTEDNAVINIDDQAGIIFYYTDTEVGSSGSPGFNDFWEVASLHYTGVPATNETGQWLTKDGSLWDKHTMTDDQVNWIANAGKSVSKIIEHLIILKMEPEHQKYIQAILEHTKDPLTAAVEVAPKPVVNDNIGLNGRNSEGGITMNFYGNTSVTINNTYSTAPVVAADTFSLTGAGIAATEKKERFDEDYNRRIGYRADFLENFRIPLPSVSKDKEKELYKSFEEDKPYIAKYIHYSLTINKKRRMAMWTASNVDYNPKLRDAREREDFGSGAWRLDPRIPAKYQIQASEFYDPATLIDKGHLVRRDDSVWAPLLGGQSDSLGIEYANADTFHWTNCTPQHEAFNRDMAQYSGVGKWGILENAVKKQLDGNDINEDYGHRACVFAGPVLDDDDPEYLDIQYPLQFWKVFAINSASAGKLVYGFLLSQKDKIDENGLAREGRPRFNRKVQAMQVSLSRIESLTGVQFDIILHEADVMAGNGGNEELRDDISNFRIARP